MRLSTCRPLIFLGEARPELKDMNSLIGERRDQDVGSIRFPEFCLSLYRDMLYLPQEG